MVSKIAPDGHQIAVHLCQFIEIGLSIEIILGFFNQSDDEDKLLNTYLSV